MNPFYKIKNWSIDKWDDYQDAQKILATIMSITILIHEDKFFKRPDINRNDVQAWVRKQLADIHEIYTIPVGSSWASFVSKEEYEKYIDETLTDNAHEYCGIRLIYNERYEQLFNDKVDFNYFAGDRN